LGRPMMETKPERNAMVIYFRALDLS